MYFTDTLTNEKRKTSKLFIQICWSLGRAIKVCSVTSWLARLLSQVHHVNTVKTSLICSQSPVTSLSLSHVTLNTACHIPVKLSSHAQLNAQRFWSLIGWEWSSVLDTGLWLAVTLSAPAQWSQPQHKTFYCGASESSQIFSTLQR